MPFLVLSFVIVLLFAIIYIALFDGRALYVTALYVVSCTLFLGWLASHLDFWNYVHFFYVSDIEKDDHIAAHRHYVAQNFHKILLHNLLETGSPWEKLSLRRSGLAVDFEVSPLSNETLRYCRYYGLQLDLSSELSEFKQNLYNNNRLDARGKIFVTRDACSKFTNISSMQWMGDHVFYTWREWHIKGVQRNINTYGCLCKCYYRLLILVGY
jgi:hypothetical protein